VTNVDRDREIPRDTPDEKVEVPYSAHGTLEINANIPDGAPDTVVRSATENTATLKFLSHGFKDGG
jgi:hypothetical protein